MHEMSVGRSRRPWCFHKRGISLDDQLANDCEFALTIDERRDSVNDLEDEENDCLRRRFGRLLSSEDMADVHFVVGSLQRQLRIPAHSLVLSVGSQLFKQMFFDSKAEKEIIVEDVEPHAFLQFLRHFYCDDFNLTKENAIAILSLSRRFQVYSLERRCQSFAKNSINESNCLLLWLSAKRFAEDEIATLAKRLIERNAQKALQSPDLLRADFDSMVELLEDENLRIPEIQLFSLLARWAKSQCVAKGLVPTRVNVRQVLGSALDLVRFPLMSEEEIRGRVSQEGLLEDDVLRALLSSHRTWPRSTRSLPFSARPRTFQRLLGPMLSVQRFQSFDNQKSVTTMTPSLAFSSSQTIFLCAIGIYAPKRGQHCLKVELDIRRQDINEVSIVDSAQLTTHVTSDGSQPVLTIRIDPSLEIVANALYSIRAFISLDNRLKERDIHFYYGLGPLLATTVSPKNSLNSILFSFESLDDNSVSCGDVVSAPPTPNPPPRPPPPKEYRRSSRISRLKRALSFSDKSLVKEESIVSSGQIPALMFYL